jgi:hypothetical protein
MNAKMCAITRMCLRILHFSARSLASKVLVSIYLKTYPNETEKNTNVFNVTRGLESLRCFDRACNSTGARLAAGRLPNTHGMFE